MSLTKISYSMIDGAVGNVKDYGADPSASAATNNDAFNAALAAHTAVFVPSDGEYTISAVVLEASGRHLFGENAKLKVAAGTTGNAIRIGSASGGWAARINSTQITGISVDSTLAAGATCIRAQFVEGIKFSNVNTNGGLRGLDINTAASVHVDSCGFGAASAHALLIESSTDGIGTWAWVTNSAMYGSGDGAIISNFPSVWVDKNVIFSNTGYGLTVQMDGAYATSGTYAVITDNDFDSCGEQGLILANQTKFIIKGNWVSCGRTAPENGISLFGCRRGSISENQIFSCGLSGLWMDGCTDINIVNNTSTDSTVAAVYIANTDNVQVLGNTLARTPEQFQPTGQAYGVYADSASSAVKIIANNIYGNVTKNIENVSGDGATNIFNSTAASPIGLTYVGDVSNVIKTLANGETIDIPNFSGQVIVNCLPAGGLGMWLAGGGAVTSIGTVSGGPFGALTNNVGINGYTFTNTSGSSQSYSMALIRTRLED